jgi:gas vesicle protein GvpG
VFILDRLLIGGLGFVLDKVARAADGEGDTQEAVRERLLEAQMRFESGDIGEDEFADIERDCMERLRELRGSGAAVLGGDDARVAEVEIESGGDEDR